MFSFFSIVPFQISCSFLLIINLFFLRASEQLVTSRLILYVPLFRYDTDNFWHCAVRYYTGPENHQASSCRMGPASDPTAVVNNLLEVHGIDGIRVMDASAMPILVSGNTHATIVMMAERGVDFIKRRWAPTLANRGGFTTKKPFGGTYPSPQYNLVKKNTQEQYFGKGTTVGSYHQPKQYQGGTSQYSQYQKVIRQQFPNMYQWTGQYDHSHDYDGYYSR